MHKILIMIYQKELRQQLDEALQEIPQEGGELFFVKEREALSALLNEENPQILFIDDKAYQESQESIAHYKGYTILVTQNPDNLSLQIDTLKIPFTPQEVKEKYQALFSSGGGEAPNLPLPLM